MILGKPVLLPEEEDMSLSCLDLCAKRLRNVDFFIIDFEHMVFQIRHLYAVFLTLIGSIAIYEVDCREHDQGSQCHKDGYNYFLFHFAYFFN